MKIVDNINDNIFRGYDIRGIYGTDLDEDTSYTIGVAFGTKMRNEDKHQVVIGYDNRTSSPSLYESLVAGIINTGINVISVGLVTTPMYYYALYYFKGDAGIMITASHNPKEYNGFKMSFNGVYNAYGEDIQVFKDFVKQKEFVYGKGNINNEDIKDKYLDYITSSIKLGSRKLKAIVDCGNGTGSTIIRSVLNRMSIDYIPIYCESNPDFPYHHPDPFVEKNLEGLKKKVIEEHADVGFSYDGDADRIGIIDEQGKMINIDLFMIIIIRNIINDLTDKRFLYDVKCSKALQDEIIKLGGTPICGKTGNSYLRARVTEDNIPFGGEFSGHVCFNDKFYGADDAIYASLRMMEILTNTDKNISALLEDITTYYSTPELKREVSDDIKFDKIKEVINYCENKGYRTLLIDGCKILFDDGSALIRASNTGPNITMRYEAKTKERLQDIETEFNALLSKILI